MNETEQKGNTMSKKTYVLTTEELSAIARDALDQDRNRSLSAEGISMLDPEGFHVVGFHMIHNDDEIRAEIFCKVIDSDEPVTVWQDMRIDAFANLNPIQTQQAPA